MYRANLFFVYSIPRRIREFHFKITFYLLDGIGNFMALWNQWQPPDRLSHESANPVKYEIKYEEKYCFLVGNIYILWISEINQSVAQSSHEPIDQ